MAPRTAEQPHAGLGSHPMEDMTSHRRIEIRQINVDLIDPNPNQHRLVFDNIDSLAASIKRKGVLQPVSLNRNGNRYTLVHGERRWRASQLAGKSTIPAIVKEEGDDDQEFSLIENIQRDDLTAVEESLEISSFNARGYSYQELAEITGKSESYISQAIKIAQFSTAYGDKTWLASLRTPKGQKLGREAYLQAAYKPTVEEGIELLKKIAENGLSVREARIGKRNTRISPVTVKDYIKQLKAVHKGISRKIGIEIAPASLVTSEKAREHVTKEIDTAIEEFKKAIEILSTTKSNLWNKES
jgi:ParB family chromosome partitioning protein